MYVFGLVFILYFRKMPAGKEFWFHLRTTDFIVYKYAIRLESISKKVDQRKLDINFLSQCRDTNTIPYITNLKKLKQMNKRRRFKFCRKLLYDKISDKHESLKELRKQQQDSQNLLKNVATWMKQEYKTYSKNCFISKNFAVVKSCHARKHNCLLNKCNAENGIQSNPKNVVQNLSSRNKTNEVYDVLLYALNHGHATNFSSKDVLPSIESVWDQLSRNNLLKENCYSINRAKNCLRALVSNLIDLDNQNVLKMKGNFKL